MAEPLVSVLIPVYNGDRFIKEALDSVLAQTYKNIEVILVDDGSKDKSAEIIKKYTDPRVHYIYQENGGIIAARNRMLREAKGEFLTYLDNDDYFLPDRVRACVEFLQSHQDYAAVYTEIDYFYDGAPDHFYRHTFEHPSGDIFVPLLDRMFITNSAYMMRASVVKEIGYYNPEKGIVEDWEYFLRMARKGMKFGFISTPLTRFRLRWDNSTRWESQPKVQWSGVAIFESLSAEMTAEERIKYNMAKRVYDHKFKLAVACLGAGEKKQFYNVWWNMRTDFGWRLLALPVFIGVAIVPTAVFRWMLENVWNRKKKNYFVPV